MPTVELAGTAGPIPDRSRAQRLEALAEANAVRYWRAALKRDIRARRRTVAELLVDPPAQLATMQILELVMVMPRIGRVKAVKALTAAGVAPTKSVGGLTDRQRRELALELGERQQRLACA